MPSGCSHSLGQTCLVSQGSDSCASPMQWPPHLGVGRLHARRRIWIPLEQVTEQAAQGPQSDQPPISVEEKRRNKMEVVVSLSGPGFLMYPTSAYPIPPVSAIPGLPSLLIWTIAVAFTLVPLLCYSAHTVCLPDSKRDLSQPKSDHVFLPSLHHSE